MTIFNLGSINIDHVYRLPAMPRGEDPPTALCHAAAAAALQVTRPGAGDAMPDRAEVQAFLNAHPG